MATVVNTLEAKTRLSRLIALAEAGEEVIVARAGKPVVRLVPVGPPRRREFGFGAFDISPEHPFFEPLPAEEIARWE
ncbi:MAG: type II toxin-antitoxin system prevent-host-death family antitoxin [Bifidobacteriaceae bacterium]|jgi:prevent-host-death family protein|nr:type II toxin-antitoxin system prevent-host-death family antitoxin [Bifidobacteriaceae bacterium]